MKATKSKIKLYSLLMLLTGVINVSAQSEIKHSLGGGIQAGTYSEPGYEIDVSGLYLAYNAEFNSWAGLEAALGYNWGDDEIVVSFETVHIDVSFKPRYELDKFSVYGKLGLSYMTRYVSVGWGTVTDSGFGILLGAGVEYSFTEKFSMHADLNTYQGDDVDYTPMIHLGGCLHF